MIRVLIADDHALTLAAVRDALQEDGGIRIVAEASSGRAALAAVQRSAPHVVLLDMHMPGAVDGPTCVERIRKRFPEVRVVMLSGFSDEASIRMAFRRGVHAFIANAVDPSAIPPSLPP